MSTAREQARKAVMKVPILAGKYTAADATSDVWEPIVKDCLWLFEWVAKRMELHGIAHNEVDMMINRLRKEIGE